MTEFTTWRSLVDGQRISAIPDSVDEYMELYWPMNEGSDTTLTDEIGDENGSIENGGGWTFDTTFDRDVVEVDNGEFIRSDNTFWVGGENATLIGWLYVEDKGDFNHGFLGAHDDLDDSESNGYYFSPRESGENDRYYHADSGSHSRIDNSYDAPEGEWLMYAAAVNGDSADWWVFNDDGIDHHQSGSQSRGIVNAHIHAGERFGASQVHARVTKIMAAQSTLSESNVAEIWEDTKPF